MNIRPLSPGSGQPSSAPPPATCWCDAISLEPLRVDVDYPGFGGRLTFLRTTKDAATKPITRPFEVFNAQSIALDRPLPGVHAKASAVFKVSILDDADTVVAEVEKLLSIRRKDRAKA